MIKNQYLYHCHKKNCEQQFTIQKNKYYQTKIINLLGLPPLSCNIYHILYQKHIFNKAYK